ncbi:adenylate/guanylate cyclase domain-containing protein [Methylococcus mesophilus]|uniref:adenylate/guanylate cyclase domain-containing protein n=1 Tax=Methylococcus mesophilus TaxID=2993564 RepID=UPI00224A5456|nr:adenylate/guanylate cyclase domain-containing protein [Methylococcus mesophilus]UZR28280.1 globin domain-containing protein [Methylococcus mesophilus]
MPKVTYFHEITFEDIPEGQTLLDVSIHHRIPHLHQCGGQARCTTCRIQILDGLSHVSPRSPLEEKVASERGWDEFTRLACQTHVHGDVVVRRLLDNSQDIIVLDLEELHGGSAGEGKELDLAVLFSDIRDFTTHSEQNLPYDIVHMLNRYFTAAAEPVLNNNGFIDKYIGDGILAAFGTRDESPETACRNAVRAALGMLEAARRLAPTLEQQFHVPLHIGIGIHFGTAILGRIGHPGKRQITVIGDTVNTASRIESMTKEFATPILLSDSVVSQLPGALQLDPPFAVPLKGKTAPMQLYPCRGFTVPDTIFLVQSSFDNLVPRAAAFGERFYANLFDTYPELRPLFRSDLTAQSKMLMSILSSAVKGLNRMPEIVGGLRALGKRHQEYGVSRIDYDKVSRVLIRTLEEFLAEEFTPEVQHAWRTVYGMIAETMIEAAEN